MLGPTYDYTHRLLDFTLLANGETPPLKTAERPPEATPHVLTCWCSRLAKAEQESHARPDDITRNPPVYPCSRSSRLQQLVRGDEGYLLALAYSTQRGYGRNHPLPVRFAAATSPLRSSPKSWVLRSISANC